MKAFFDKLKGDDKNNNKNRNNNPFANFGGPRTFGGQGQSLGGSQPGKVFSVTLEYPGTLGMKVRHTMRVDFIFVSMLRCRPLSDFEPSFTLTPSLSKPPFRLKRDPIRQEVPLSP